MSKWLEIWRARCDCLIPGLSEEDTQSVSYQVWLILQKVAKAGNFVLLENQ